MRSINEIIAEELSAGTEQVVAAVQLLDEGLLCRLLPVTVRR